MIGLVAGHAAHSSSTSTRGAGASRSALIAFVSAANIYSLVALTHYLLHHNVTQAAAS